MAQLRLNDITREQIIVVENRSKRPKDYKSCEVVERVSYKESCPFCVGNEEMTPPEVLRIDDPWNVRVVENKFPILNNEGEVTGYHYVVIEGRDHSKNIHEMEVDEFEKVVYAFIEVSRILYQKEGVKYVQVFKNYKKEAGASLEHPHSQIIAINRMSDRIKGLIEKEKEFYEKHGECLTCSKIKDEIINKERIVYLDEYFLIFCPYDSIFPYEMAVVPIRHRSSLLSLKESDIKALSRVLHFAIKSLIENVGNVAYNMFFEFIKDEVEYHHYQIRICPRISIHAGFELATGFYTNVVSPETAARILRGQD